MPFYQYSWNSKVETTWISLIGWLHKTSTIDLFTIGGSQVLPIKSEQWTKVDKNIEEYGNDYDYDPDFDYDYDEDGGYGSVEVKCTNIAGIQISKKLPQACGLDQFYT